MWDSQKRERERERERDDNKRYIIRRDDTRIVRKLKVGVELNWLEIMPCDSIYSVVTSTLEVSRMF